MVGVRNALRGFMWPRNRAGHQWVPGPAGDGPFLTAQAPAILIKERPLERTPILPDLCGPRVQVGRRRLRSLLMPTDCYTTAKEV